MSNVIVVGAGPAGIAAAGALIDHGIHPVVIDEAPHAGGQAYRASGGYVQLDIEHLMGTEHAAYKRFYDTAKQVRERADYRSQTAVWGIHEKELFLNSPSGPNRLRYDTLIAATGAIDRILPVHGWTLPGVYTLGGAQALLKGQGHLIGRRVVFCGSSPLLYLAALQYHLSGCQVVAVLDTTPFSEKVKAVPKLAASLSTLKRGISHIRTLSRAGIAIEHGVKLQAFLPHEASDAEAGVARVVFKDSAANLQELACDAVAFGFGLRPETQLAALAGSEFHFDPVYRQWFPTINEDGRAGELLYLAGDGAAIGGAEAARLSGRLAALAALRGLGHAVPSREFGRLRAVTSRLRRFQTGLARAFAWPSHIASHVDDKTLVCRCENVTAGALRSAVQAQFGPLEINRLKALTRCGMGRCQGRFCENAASEIAASALGCPIESIGRLRGQPPIKPVPMSLASPDETAG